MAFNLPNLLKSEMESLWKGKKDINNVVDDAFTNFYKGLPYFTNLKNIEEIFSPRLDVSETESAYFLEMEIPGVDQKDIEVKSENNILTIAGKKEESSEKKNRNYYSQERYYGVFRRSLSLPNNIIENDITANFKNGVLEVKIPKKEESKSKKIEVKS